TAQTNSSVIFNITSIAEGNLSWTCYACDNHSSCNFSASNYTLTIDDTQPTYIDFVSPTSQNESNITNAASNVYINVSTTEKYNHSAFVDWNKSLVGWWRFEENNGTAMNDSSTWGNNASCNTGYCPEWTTGARGKALKFDGVNDFIQIADRDLLDFGNFTNFTVCAWTKFSHVSPNSDTRHYIVSKGNQEAANYPSWSLHQTGNGQIAFYVDSINGQDSALTSTNVVDVNQFYHICALRVNNDKLYIYLNGLLNGSLSATSTSNQDLSNNYALTIGSLHNEVWKTFDGTIDEVMIWSRALSAQEINASYRNQDYRLERNFTSLDPGKYEFKAYVVDMAGNLNETGWYEVHVNHLPTATAVSINPSSPVRTDDLNCSFNITDNDATDSLQANITWYKNGAYNTSFLIAISNNVQASNVLKAANTSKLENWTCAVKGLDAKSEYGTTANASVIIAGTGLNATLDSPLDHWITNSSVTFECNASSDANLKNITLWHNASGTWEKNESSTLPAAATGSIIFNITGLAEGNLSWNCLACDIENQCDFAPSNYTIEIDDTQPSYIDFVSPTPQNESNITNAASNVYVNVSTTETYNHSAFIDWNKSLMGWWRFEENNGTTINDSSTGDNNGTIIGATWTTGPRGKALKFDGADDYVGFGDQADLDITGNITITLWFKSAATTFDTFVYNLDTSNPDNGYVLSISNGAFGNGDKIAFSLAKDNTYDTFTTTSSYSDNEWHFLAAGYTPDGSSRPKIYVDGLEVAGTASGSALSSIGTTSGYNFLIGAYSDGSSYNFEGTIDEVMVWDRALSTQEINASFRNQDYRLERNFTGLATGRYEFKAYVVDMAGNLNETGWYEVQVNHLPTATDVSISPTVANTTSGLNCSFNITDNDATDDIYANISWYNGTVLYKIYKISVGNNVKASNVLKAANTSRYENWTCSVVGYDGFEYSSTTANASRYISNAPPTHNTPIINSSSAENRTDENITVWNQTTNDVDNDSYTNIIRWVVDNNPLMAVYMPFDSNISSSTASLIKDYSGSNKNGTLGNSSGNTQPNWTSSGHSGGAYKFDGINDQLITPSTVNARPNISITAWVNPGVLNDNVYAVSYGGQEAVLYCYSNSKCIALMVNNSNSQQFTGQCSVPAGQYTFLALTYENSTYNLTLYTNGQPCASKIVDGGARLNQGTIAVGSNVDGESNFFNGTIDEVRMYNRSLSSEQVAALYANETHKIVQQETAKGENWTACITPNDALEDGTEKCSSLIVLGNGAPTKPVLQDPTDGNITITNRTVNFTWTASTDPDDDPLTYNITVRCYSTAGGSCSPSDDRDYSGITAASYETPIELYHLYDDSMYYEWNVTVSDGSLTNWSTTWNFSISSLIIINFTTDTVDFGSMNPGTANNTVNTTVSPLLIENKGNSYLNISIKGTQLLSASDFPSSDFMFKIDNKTGEEGAFNASSLTSWTNMMSTYQTSIQKFNYSSTMDEAEIDIYVNVLSYEPSGDKESTITALGAYTSAI
ncbi:MAG: LamG domain-containing protein, partial [Candidatus Woesearchaeota archaeon]